MSDNDGQGDGTATPPYDPTRDIDPTVNPATGFVIHTQGVLSSTSPYDSTVPRTYFRMGGPDEALENALPYFSQIESAADYGGFYTYATGRARYKAMGSTTLLAQAPVAAEPATPNPSTTYLKIPPDAPLQAYLRLGAFDPGTAYNNETLAEEAIAANPSKYKPGDEDIDQADLDAAEQTLIAQDKVEDKSKDEVGVYIYSDGTFRNWASAFEQFSGNLMEVVQDTDDTLIKAEYIEGKEVAGTPTKLAYERMASYETSFGIKSEAGLQEALDISFADKRESSFGFETAVKFGLAGVSLSASLLDVKIEDNELEVGGLFKSHFASDQTVSSSSLIKFTVNPLREPVKEVKETFLKATTAAFVAAQIAGGLALADLETRLSSATWGSEDVDTLKEYMEDLKWVHVAFGGLTLVAEIGGIVLAICQLLMDKVGIAADLLASRIELGPSGVIISAGMSQIVIDQAGIAFGAPEMTSLTFLKTTEPGVEIPLTYALGAAAADAGGAPEAPPGGEAPGGEGEGLGEEGGGEEQLDENREDAPEDEVHDNEDEEEPDREAEQRPDDEASESEQEDQDDDEEHSDDEEEDLDDEQEEEQDQPRDDDHDEPQNQEERNEDEPASDRDDASEDGRSSDDEADDEADQDDEEDRRSPDYKRSIGKLD